MRMWMVDPKIMCRQHLLGEHREMHALRGMIMKGLSLDGYVRNNCLQFRDIKKRHDRIVAEMIRRGYNHYSPLEEIPDMVTIKYSYFVQESKVDVESSLQDLLQRCVRCSKRFKKLRRNNGEQ